jgi:lipopolysaccharide export system permease protein
MERDDDKTTAATTMKFLKLTIIDKYIIRKYLGTFLFAILLVVVISVVFDLSEHIDDFFEHDAPIKEIIFNFYLNFVPYFVILYAALISFIAVIFFTSKMADSTEIIAILSSGMSFMRMVRPFFIAAGIISVSSFIISNFYLPSANRVRLQFYETYIKGGPKYFSDQDIHKQISPGLYVYLQSYNTHNNTGQKFSLEKFENGRLVSKLMAEGIRWDSIQGKWEVRNYFMRTIGDSTESIKDGALIDTTLNMFPEDFKKKNDISYFETMTLGELNEYIDDLRLQGADNINVYLVERGRRFAFPMSTFILTFIGLTLSSRKVKGGIGMHMGAGLALAFSYIFLLQFSSQFAISGSLSPTLAAWLPNIIYTVICIFLYKIAPK